MAYTPAVGAYAQGDVSIRESLWDQIKDLDPIELYVTTNAGNVPVTQKIHSWVIDPITATAAQAGTVELADTTFAAVNPTLRINTTQIIEKGIAVSGTQLNSKHAGFSDKFAREQLKKMKEWKQQLEFSAVAGVMATATGTAARAMAGIWAYASLTSILASGVSLTSDMLNAYLGNAWNFGGDHDTVLVGRVLKERISAFVTGGNTRNVPASEAITVGRIDIYDSDHGRVKIVKHRYVNYVGEALNEQMVTYINDYVQVGFLDEPHYEDRAKTGYYKAGAIVGEATVQVDNPCAVQTIRCIK